MSPPLLEVDGLRAGYGSGEILQGVGLQMQPGEMVATIGRNGVGKSTLMKAIMGMLTATAGAVRDDKCAPDHGSGRLAGRTSREKLVGFPYVDTHSGHC